MQAKSVLLAGGALLAATTGALASGFQINLANHKNIGMGHTGTGLYLDAGSQFFNPGALVFSPSGLVFGANLAVPRLAYRADGTGADQRILDNKNVFPFSGYASFGPKDGKVKFGIGAYTPFGSELHYQKGWEGRYALTDITLQSVFVQGTVSVAITPQLAVGAGLVSLAYGNVDLQRDVPLQGQGAADPLHVQLSGKSDVKFGYNLGIMFKPSAKLSVGISYRSAIDATVTGGDVTVTNLPASVAGRFTAKAFNVTLPLPSTTSIGIGVYPSEKLTLAFDANLVGWSRYQSLDFTYGGGGLLGGQASSTSKRQYQDALAFRLGGQYKVTDKFTVRAGTFYDFACVPDGFVTPETPDADRIGATAGFSYALNERFGLDGSYLFENFLQRSQTQADLVTNGTTDRVAGTYKTAVHVPGVGLYVKF